MNEADLFKDIAVKMGVPEDRIMVENQATNTGENVRFSYRVKKYKVFLMSRFF